jgi:hypothetical protein
LIIGAIAADPADDFAITAKIGFAGRQHFDLPALALGIARIHPKNVAGKQRRLVAAGTGPDFEDDALFVIRVARQQQALQFDFEFGQTRLGGRHLFLGKLAHVGIGEHGFGFGDVVFGLAEGAKLDDNGLQLGALARQPAELIHVVGGTRGRQHAIDFIETVDQQVEFLADARFHFGWSVA